ncbi:hypothetical protein CBFG_03211 [Clostridiales bacterium 1_7_47FAA]|nr:hypothetical protein CBFG_03211 [Clostridiales bacterium 1_7_47FAA]
MIRHTENRGWIVADTKGGRPGGPPPLSGCIFRSIYYILLGISELFPVRRQFSVRMYFHNKD